MTTPVHLVCGHCDAVVRVPHDKLDAGPRCPQCHEALLDGQPIALTTANFERHLQRSDLPLVVDVWAPWCGPCRTMAPQFAAAAQTLRSVRFAKLNSDEAPTLAGRLNIRSIPTLIVFRRGQELARQSGVMNSAHLVKWLNDALSGAPA